MHVHALLSLVDLCSPLRGKQGESVGVYVRVLAFCVSVLVVIVCGVYVSCTCALCVCVPLGICAQPPYSLYLGDWSCCSIVSLWLPDAA